MNIDKACKILRTELLKHGALYDGFHASIMSAINDASNYTSADALSTMILSRIIGED